MKLFVESHPACPEHDAGHPERPARVGGGAPGQGGGRLSLDTGAGPGSWAAASVAAGSGLEVAHRLE